MNDMDNNITLEDTNAFLDNTFSSLDLNEDLSKIYEIINDNELQNEFDKQVDLTSLRDDNYKKYTNINIIKYKNLPSDFDNVVDDILSSYNNINVSNILSDNYEDSRNNKVILENINRQITRLDNMVNSYLKELTSSNDEKQNKFSMVYFKSLDIDDKLKKELIDKYDDLVIESSQISNDIYEELDIQLKRKNGIDEILSIINKEDENKNRVLNQERLYSLNRIINLGILRYSDKIHYLEDLMPENSKYLNEFNEFKDFFNKLIAYDDTNYESAKQTEEILNNETRLNEYVNRFEQLFINEINNKNKEEKFIYENVGIKNLRTSLNYISANYMDKLNDENKNIIKYIYDKLNSNIYDLNELNKALKLVVNDLWNNTITNVYSFNPNEDYYFICSNNQFIDAKYQTIMISKREIDRVNDYEDYQIGFICGYNDNIMYITENEDIMTVDSDDMSNLKTPLQLEQEFINFKVCNRIALNGYKTKIQAVYFINDGNKDKYIKALDLANMYKLPLIVLKK